MAGTTESPQHTSSYPEHVEQIVTLTKAKGFLAREFLTWVWYQCEKAPDAIRVRNPFGKGQLPTTMWVDDRIILEATSGEVHESILKGGHPSTSTEASLGLAAGKSVRELRLGITVEGLGDFTAVVNCTDLCPRGIQLPDLSEAGDNDLQTRKLGAPLGTRLSLVRVLTSFLDDLFAKFVDERMSKDWKSEGLTEMRQWIKERRSKEGVLH